MVGYPRLLVLALLVVVSQQQQVPRQPLTGELAPCPCSVLQFRTPAWPEAWFAGADFGVLHFDIPGKVLRNTSAIGKSYHRASGAAAPVLLTVFVKGFWTSDSQLQLRGHAFALSATKEHWSISGRHFSQSPAIQHWYPRFWLAHEASKWEAEVSSMADWEQADGSGEARYLMPFRYTRSSAPLCMLLAFPQCPGFRSAWHLNACKVC